MPTPVTMPRLGLSMVEGTVVEWRARPGTAVERGETVLVIESEKAEVEVEAFADGVLAAVYVEPGQTVPIGTLLGAIVSPDEAFDAEAFAAAYVPEREGAPAIAGERPAVSAAPSASAPASAAVKAAPAARSLARRLGIEIESVSGTGPGGRILPEDVERAAASLAPVNGTRLSFAVAGDGPTVLLVSGFGVDASGWRRQTEDLAADFRVVTYDHRGIGRSAPPGDEGLSLETLADDAAGVLRHAGAPPALVVGASMGAAISLELALRHPQAVRGLVLVSPVLRPDPRFAAVLRSWCEDSDPVTPGRISSMLPWFFGRAFLADATRREAAAAALRAMGRNTPTGVLGRHAEALLGWLGTREHDLAAVGCPALVLVGTDDLLTPPSEGELVATRLPNSRLVRFPDVGHAILVERPNELCAAVRELAAR